MAATLLAAEDKPNPFPFLLQGTYIAGALLVGAVIIALVNRWRKNAADSRLSASDQMAQFRALYEKGQLSQEEYESLRRVLGGELRRSLKVKPTGTPAAVPPAEPTPAPPAAKEPPPNGAVKPDEPPQDGIRPA
jgi:hypothetical protein